MSTLDRFFSMLCFLLASSAMIGCTSTPVNSSTSPTHQPSTPWTIQYQRSGGIMGLAQSANFTASGTRSVSHHGKPAEMLPTLNPSALTHLSNLVNLVAKETPAKKINKTPKCADCIRESVQLQVDNSVVYYANNAPITAAKEELLRFLAEHIPMR